jgi:predicted Na+-dependent transporter
VGSTVITVVIAGPILVLEAGHSHVHTVHVLANLIVVVALPLVAGSIVRRVRPLRRRGRRTALTIATACVAGLVALVAAEIHFTVGYVAVAGALLLFLLGSALIGRILGWSSPAAAVASILLTTSMRDFAIAAALAAAAFGPTAAGPLGLYGVLVLLWGTGAAGWLRRR